VVAAFEASQPEFEPLGLPVIPGSPGLHGPGLARFIWPQDLDGNGMFIAGWRRKRR